MIDYSSKVDHPPEGTHLPRKGVGAGVKNSQGSFSTPLTVPSHTNINDVQTPFPCSKKTSEQGENNSISVASGNLPRGGVLPSDMTFYNRNTTSHDGTRANSRGCSVSPPGNTGEPVIVRESKGGGAPVSSQVVFPPTQVCDQLPSYLHQDHNLASPGGVISSHGYYSATTALEQVSAQYPSLRGGFGAQLQSRGAHRGEMGTLFYSNNQISSPKDAPRTVNTDHLPRETARIAQSSAPDSRANISPREILIYNQAISDKGFSETNTSRSDPQEIGVPDASRKVNIDPLPRESVRFCPESRP